ncbi:MAG: DUF1015 domain-containing protein, partial [Flavobacteriaceae bacterium]
DLAQIKPFKAIRPTKDKAALVVSRSYQSYSRRELNSVLSFNPFSFLHIINPGYKFSKKAKGKERFQLVHYRYLEFLENNTFLKDAQDCFYQYQLEADDFSCSGLFCAIGVSEYRNEVIKKHEDTIEKRESLFADYLETVKFNAEPVLMTYAKNPDVSEILRMVRTNEPEYFFTTTDRVTHRLWVISAQETVTKLQEAFGQIPHLYIADGHHRSASSSLLAANMQKNNPRHSGKEPYNFFMSYLIPESEINIFEYNRLVKDLNGLSKAEFLVRLDSCYQIENQGKLSYVPHQKHHFSMYLEGEFYSLYLRKNGYRFTDALSRLDTQILLKTILEPILGIRDLRNDKRIHYGHGKHNAIQMKKNIDQGKFKVGFGMVPINIDEIKAIADAGQIMPPKSTYIEPKLRSGMTIYEL